ncbi:acyl carrier protein [bacterium]|nr:acyl carrier protein [bacterium]
MDIQDAVFEKVAEQKGVDKSALTRDTTFLEVGADSLDMVEFSLDLEDHFKITINQSDIGSIKTLGQAIDFIRLPSENPVPLGAGMNGG